MAVYGTPCSDACPTPEGVSQTACDQQNRYDPVVSRFFGEALYERMRTISVSHGRPATIVWNLVDRQGKAVDLTNCTSWEPRLAFAEALSSGFDGTPIVGTITDPAKGELTFSLTAGDVPSPGLYYAEAQLVSDPGGANEQVEASNLFYLLVQPSVGNLQGPPSLAEIRLHLRDSSPQESLLLDSVKFDDSEIALAIVRPIQQFNDTPPDILQKFTTQNFPWRYYWLEAICGNLFLIAAEHYRANRLPYSAAGVQVDDMGKENPYLAAAQRRLEIWRRFVNDKKLQLNNEEGWGVIEGLYSWY